MQTSNFRRIRPDRCVRVSKPGFYGLKNPIRPTHSTDNDVIPSSESLNSESETSVTEEREA